MLDLLTPYVSGLNFLICPYFHTWLTEWCGVLKQHVEPFLVLVAIADENPAAIFRVPSICVMSVCSRSWLLHILQASLGRVGQARYYVLNINRSDNSRRRFIKMVFFA